MGDIALAIGAERDCIDIEGDWKVYAGLEWKESWPGMPNC